MSSSTDTIQVPNLLLARSGTYARDLIDKLNLSGAWITAGVFSSQTGRRFDRIVVVGQLDGDWGNPYLKDKAKYVLEELPTRLNFGGRIEYVLAESACVAID